MGMYRCATGSVVLLLASASLSVRAMGQAAFEPGDLYLVSVCLSGDGGFCGSGVMRIDPSDWSSERLVDLAPQLAPTRGAYDAFRDRLVIGGENLWLMEADGTVALLSAVGGVQGIACDGQRRIYECASTWISVYDAFDVKHDLLDGGGSPVQMFDVTSLWYDRATHSLIVGQGVVVTTLTRLPLSADGLSVGGAPVSVALDVSPGSFEGPVGFSSGPGGSVFVKIDDNTNGLVPRMLLLDVPTMGLSVFASNEYFGVAGETAGAYSEVAGGAITVDTTGDQLRFFAQGSVGEGGAIAVPGISGAGGGEHCQLIPIEVPSACPADLNGDGVLDFFDVQRFLAGFAAHDPEGDFNSDGAWDFFDVQAFLQAFAGGCA